MKISASFFISCFGDLTPFADAGDGLICFYQCTRAFFQVYRRCLAEWDYGTDGFWRCCDGNVENFYECYLDDCPKDSCEKICYGFWEQDIKTCLGLYENGLIGTLEYRVCIKKAELDLEQCVETCFCDKLEIPSCICPPKPVPQDLMDIVTRWDECEMPVPI
ncbi:unnamed protein product [Oikopleura dioica]|uniref:Uncharacterized protein n=1 Tax=Oikopleura dioica TaxID=34765 RepID=E4XZG6_OIKDI|nr:unnamed protein product [Oikopleura dioica]CBY35932.1 unnamed protein product [Oikopleura dioica]